MINSGSRVPSAQTVATRLAASALLCSLGRTNSSLAVLFYATTVIGVVSIRARVFIIDSTVFHICAEWVTLKSRQRKRKATKNFATASDVEASARALSIPTGLTRRSCGCLFKKQ